jgi:hypothetical protein
MKLVAIVAILSLASLFAVSVGAQAALADVASPGVSSINPNSGANTGNVAVVVTGSSFVNGLHVELDKGASKIQATGVSVTGSTSIKCTLDLTGAVAGSWDVKVTNPDGHAGTLIGGFTITGPSGNDTFEPNGTTAQAYGPLTAGVTYESYIAVDGDLDFYKLTVPAGYARLTARMSSIPYGCDYDLVLFDATGKKVGGSGNGNNTDEQIDLASPKAGQYFLEVKPWTGFSASDSYLISYTLTSAPVIKSISPASGVPGASVTLAGSSFGSVKDGSSVTFGSVQCSSNLYLSWSADKIVVKVPAGVGGNVPISISTGAGKSNSIGFKVVPQIDSISPTAGKIGSSLTINGQGFGSKTGAASVYFGKAKATVYSSWSNYIIKVNVPAGISGTVPVQIVTDGGASQVRNYTVTK